MKEFPDYKINASQKQKFAFGKVENTVGKGETSFPGS